MTRDGQADESPRRRPPARRESQGGLGERAAALLDLKVVESPPPRADRGLVMGSMFGVTRQARYPVAVVVFEIATGTALAAVPVDGGRAAAEGMKALMERDLAEMDVRRFLARWGRGRR